MNLDFFASETLYSGNAGLSTKTFWKREKKLNETEQLCGDSFRLSLAWSYGLNSSSAWTTSPGLVSPAAIQFMWMKAKLVGITFWFYLKLHSSSRSDNLS